MGKQEETEWAVKETANSGELDVNLEVPEGHQWKLIWVYIV